MSDVKTGDIIKLNFRGVAQFPYLKDVLLTVERRIADTTLLECSPMLIYMGLVNSRYAKSTVKKPTRTYSIFVTEVEKVGCNGD